MVKNELRRKELWDKLKANKREQKALEKELQNLRKMSEHNYLDPHADSE